MNALWCVLCKANEDNGDMVVGPFESADACAEWIDDDVEINGEGEEDYSVLPFILHTSKGH